MKKNDLYWIELGERASSFRNENGLGLTDPIHFKSFLIKKDILTIFKPLSEKFAGMAIKADESVKFILVNRNHTLGKQRFTIGHELYHLFIQDNFTSHTCNTGLFENQPNIEEKKADYFAACVLLPESGVLQLIPEKERYKKNNISTETLFRIQQYYGLSINAVIYRLSELGFIDNTYYEKYSSGKISTAKKLGYDEKLFKPGESDTVVGNYGELVNKLYHERKISESYYLELLNAINIDPFAPEEKDHE